MEDNYEKLNKFRLAINHYAEQQRKKIEKEVNEFKQKELDEAEFEVLNESYNLIQKEMSEMRNKITHEIAQRELNKRKELFIKRKKIKDNVFEYAYKLLCEYTLKNDYSLLLSKYSKELSNVFDKPGTIIFIKKGDEKYKELIQKFFNSECTFKIDSGIRVGGIKACNYEMGIEADETLDSKLENQREWFEKNSGMVVV